MVVHVPNKKSELHFNISYKNTTEFQEAKEEAQHELNELDWWSNVDFIRAEEFHCKFLAYGPVHQGGYQNMFEVLMMSANVDTPCCERLSHIWNYLPQPITGFYPNHYINYFVIKRKPFISMNRFL